MNYVIIEKARPYTRTKKGKLERVKGYRSKLKKPKPGDKRIHEIDRELAEKEKKQLKSIVNNIKFSFGKRLKKIAPSGVRVKWRFNEGTFEDWDEEYSKYGGKYWFPTKNKDHPWLEWSFSGYKENDSEKYHGYGSIGFFPLSQYPSDNMSKMEFKIGDTGFGNNLKNRGLMSSIFSVLANARDKDWIGNQMHVHMGLGTKAWAKLAKKFNFDYEGINYKRPKIN